MVTKKKLSSLNDWPEPSNFEMQQVSKSLSWTMLDFKVSKLRPISECLLAPMSDYPTYSIIMSGKTQILPAFLAVDVKLSGETVGTGTLNIIPSQTPRIREAGSEFVLVIWSLSQLAISRIAAQLNYGDPQRLHLHPKYRVQSSLLQELVLEMLSELDNDECTGKVYLDYLSHTAVAYLMKHNLEEAKIPKLQRGKLSPEQKLKLETYVDARLANKIMISELANLLYMSKTHLERCFRASYAMPVYHFILLRRIERAKALLVNRELSLLEVALECGFSNQSHFNRHFKTLIGVSPGQYLSSIC